MVSFSSLLSYSAHLKDRASREFPNNLWIIQNGRNLYRVMSFFSFESFEVRSPLPLPRDPKEGWGSKIHCFSKGLHFVKRRLKNVPMCQVPHFMVPSARRYAAPGGTAGASWQAPGAKRQARRPPPSPPWALVWSPLPLPRDPKGGWGGKIHCFSKGLHFVKRRFKKVPMCQVPQVPGPSKKLIF